MGDFDLDAAGLRADGAGLATGVEVLAVKLEGALPGATTVRRRAKRRLSREQVVASVDVRLGAGRYALRVDGRAVTCTREHEVRGVVIRREELGLQEWLGALTGELRERAADSAEARAALEALVG